MKIIWWNGLSASWCVSDDGVSYRLVGGYECRELLEQGYSEISQRLAFDMGLPAEMQE